MSQLTEVGLGSRYLKINMNAYEHSMRGPHTTMADKLTFFLHTYADLVAPGRHALYESQESLNRTPEYMRPDIGAMPLEAALYTQALLDSGVRDPHTFDDIDRGFSKLFKGKVVFFLPGRTGQSVEFARQHGAVVGAVTDERYMPGLLNVLNTGDLQYNKPTTLKNRHNISFVARGSVSDILSAIYPVREDIRKLYKTVASPSQMIFADTKSSIPDIVISTNMFNIKRTDGSVKKHQIGVPKEKLLNRIIASGKPGVTSFYIIPATEHDSAFTKNEILNLLGPYGDVAFFSDEATQGSSLVNTDAQFGFKFDLVRPISPAMVQ